MYKYVGLLQAIWHKGTKTTRFYNYDFLPYFQSNLYIETYVVLTCLYIGWRSKSIKRWFNEPEERNNLKENAESWREKRNSA